ncbi:hypothetical protein AB1Y20_008677 [Prymnesium parvum]|uniref:Mediator of RNA polymerase II transcription subunit 20 n=1 Tax=Prymnesium parvum TaxID=97485 RepID=A0AB34IV79_PRYPA
MGVRLLAHTQASSDTLDERLERLGCKFTTRWQIRCAFLRPNPAATQAAGIADMFMFQASEQPQVYYILSQGVLLVAGLEISSVIDEMGTHAKRLRVTVDGSAHECGDFMVRVGKLQLNQQVQGTVVEVEYKPCSLAKAEMSVLREFLGLLLPETQAEGSRDFISSANCFDLAQDLPAEFSLQHSVCQFVSLIRAKIIGGR